MYHLSPKTGQPGICKAQAGKCPLGDGNPHFFSAEETRAYFESLNESIAPPLTKNTVSNSSPATPPPPADVNDGDDFYGDRFGMFSEKGEKAIGKAVDRFTKRISEAKTDRGVAGAIDGVIEDFKQLPKEYGEYTDTASREQILDEIDRVLINHFADDAAAEVMVDKIWHSMAYNGKATGEQIVENYRDFISE